MLVDMADFPIRADCVGRARRTRSTTRTSPGRRPARPLRGPTVDGGEHAGVHRRAGRRATAPEWHRGRRSEARASGRIRRPKHGAQGMPAVQVAALTFSSRAGEQRSGRAESERAQPEKATDADIARARRLRPRCPGRLSGQELSRRLHGAPRDLSRLLPDGQQGMPTEGRDSFFGWRYSCFGG